MAQSTRQSETTAGETNDLTTSELHWLFADPRCKQTLEALEELTLPVALDTLAARIATGDAESDGDAAAQPKIAARLHHAHLPKMDRLGLVEYDPETKRIA